MRTIFCIAIVLANLASAVAWANEFPPEIDYLLTTMGSSDCTFIRNGKNYTATEAEAHLRMKYNRGKRYAKTTEEFISNLASRSSMSKKPYYIACNEEQIVESGSWLTQLLASYRANHSEVSSDSL